MIEITSTSVEQAGRNLTFPSPVMPKFSTLSESPLIQSVAPLTLAREKTFSGPAPAIMIDRSTEAKRMTAPVQPLRAERPPYPRQAREQGWQGVVLLQLRIDDQGRVESAEVQESSGYPLLDSNAVQTVRQWTFSPAKNGNFPVTSVVKLPIKFDLRE